MTQTGNHTPGPWMVRRDEQLRAAAPELLAALKSAEGILSRAGYAEWPGGSLTEIRAAIAKAEGR